MRKGLGIAVLVVGTGLLGWWAQGHHAKRMETAISERAVTAVAGSIHGASVTVSGRDIHLSGIANGADEEAALMASLYAVPGRRLVTQDLTVLQTLDPFSLEVTKEGPTALSATGAVPTEAVRADLSAGLGEAAAGLTLAAGAPEGWAALAKGGLGALTALNKGVLSVTGANLKLTGEANSPEEMAVVDAALAGLPEGSIVKEVTLLDDGKPAAYTLDYAAGTGATLSGKLPKGLDAGAIAAAMGLSALKDSSVTAMMGDVADASGLSVFKDWMAKFETLNISVGADGRKVTAGVQGDVDAAALQSALAGGLDGYDVAVELVRPEGENGATRVNAATGATQRFMGGFWLEVPKIQLSIADCQAEADKVLAGATINFVTGGAELDASAVAVINTLGAVIAICSEQAGLKAEIGGHTDSSGDAEANKGLSQRRATAVRQELISRGVPAAALRAVGYGADIPVADNATEEGRAKNRRTTITWSE